MKRVTWPGLIDVHVHLREPGATQKEDFYTGSRAALMGGFTYLIDMPNNSTPTVSLDRLEEKITLSQKALCDIGFHYGTNGLNTDTFAQAAAHPSVFGLKLYCNHTTGEMLLEDLSLLEKVFANWNSEKPVLVHAEGVELAAAIALAHVYSRRLHVCHISQAVEVELVRLAKKKGQPITAGVCPHHLWMTGADRETLGSKAMMKPPLGTQVDQDELWAGLQDGTIDIVETDHAPHTLEEKNHTPAPFGVPGLETALGLLLKGVEEKRLKLKQVVELLHDRPQEIFHIPEQPDTYIEVDLDKKWTVGEDGYETKSGWSPFDGWELPGQVEKVVFKGETVLDARPAIIHRHLEKPEELVQPFYAANKSYEENYSQGPFGEFATEEVLKRSGKPQEKFMGLPVYQAFGIPAGPLVNGKFVTAAFKKGFDINVYKTVRSRSYPCHPWPNVLAVHIDKLKADRVDPLVADANYTQPLSITNSFGVPSMDPEIWQADMAETIKTAGKGQVMIGSFQGTGGGTVEEYIDDFATTALMVKETGAPILEINLSCPNEGTAHLLCFDIERTQKVVFKVKEAIGDTPLVIKVAYYASDKELEKLLKAVGGMVQAISTINTIPATIVDKNGQPALPGKGRERSGVCGDAVRWAGLEMVERMSKVKQQLGLNFSIIGVGGVTKPEHYAEYRAAGADAVMSATGAMWNPSLAKEIQKI